MRTVGGFVVAFSLALAGGVVFALAQFGALPGEAGWLACGLWALSFVVVAVVAPGETRRTFGGLLRELWDWLLHLLLSPFHRWR
jgi:hypothetical protein